MPILVPSSHQFHHITFNAFPQIGSVYVQQDLYLSSSTNPTSGAGGGWAGAGRGGGSVVLNAGAEGVVVVTKKKAIVGRPKDRVRTLLGG